MHRYIDSAMIATGSAGSFASGVYAYALDQQNTATVGVISGVAIAVVPLIIKIIDALKLKGRVDTLEERLATMNAQLQKRTSERDGQEDRANRLETYLQVAKSQHPDIHLPEGVCPIGSKCPMTRHRHAEENPDPDPPSPSQTEAEGIEG